MTATIQPPPRNIEGVKELTAAEARTHFDAQARRRLGMSGEEFLRRLDAGEFDDAVDLPGPIGYLEGISLDVRRSRLPR